MFLDQIKELHENLEFEEWEVLMQKNYVFFKNNTELFEITLKISDELSAVLV